jgi:MFS family permease
MFTYITTTTIPSFPEIQKMYDITYSQVTWTVAAPSLGLSFGPLLWSPLSEIYGRRIVFVTGTMIAFIATVGTAVAKTYPIYMGARFFQGLGVSPGGSVGMAIINEYVTVRPAYRPVANLIHLVCFLSMRGARK